jgi:hypothetical protein
MNHSKQAQPHELMSSHLTQATAAVLPFSKWAGELDANKYLDGLNKKLELIQGGDTKHIEAMLYGQAVALEAIFSSLAQRAAVNVGEHMKAAELYLRLALKAQSQSRATLQALAEVKNPRPVAFVQQANFANGPQQVNNGAPEKFKTEQNEQIPGQLPDNQGGLTHELVARTKGQAIGRNSSMEALGALHGAQDGRR